MIIHVYVFNSFVCNYITCIYITILFLHFLFFSIDLSLLVSQNAFLIYTDLQSFLITRRATPPNLDFF